MVLKNDLQRTGFEVTIPASSEPRLDPVAALQTYIGRTSQLRPHNSSPLFLSLKAPYQAVSAPVISQVLEEAIDLAGLQHQGFRAKSFRPTGATTAVSGIVSPEVAMKIGRWKTPQVFMDHYVHPQVPNHYTDSLLHVVP
jgi:hypothetical protein